MLKGRCSLSGLSSTSTWLRLEQSLSYDTGQDFSLCKALPTVLVVQTCLNTNLAAMPLNMHSRGGNVQAALRTIVVLRYWAGFFFVQGPFVADGVGTFDPADESFPLIDIAAQLSSEYKFGGAA